MIGYMAHLQRFAEALRDDSAIAGFCDGLGMASPNVYIGEDANSPFGLDNAPYVILAPGLSGSDEGDIQDSATIPIELDMGLSVSGDTETDGITALNGLSVMESFAALVLACVRSALEPGESVAKASYSLDASRQPLAEAGFSLEIQIDQGVSDS